MTLNLREPLRGWTTSTGIGGPIHRNTQEELEQVIKALEEQEFGGDVAAAAKAREAAIREVRGTETVQ